MNDTRYVMYYATFNRTTQIMKYLYDIFKDRITIDEKVYINVAENQNIEIFKFILSIGNYQRF